MNALPPGKGVGTEIIQEMLVREPKIEYKTAEANIENINFYLTFPLMEAV